MKNSERTIVFGFNRKVMEIIHCVMLIGMLHSSFIAPAQPIIWEFFNGNKAKHTHSSSTAFDSQDSVLSTTLRKSDSELQKSIIQHENVNLLKEKIEQKTYFQADIFDGFIGVSEDKPLDDAKDNLFKITLDEVPTHGKIYLQYELYGVEGLSSVSRSVNDMPSTGGYIVKKNTQWTLQQEELANTWLKEGVNTILFTAPSDKEFGYRVKNVSIQFKENAALNPAMVLNIDQNTLYVKENRLYIKGFVQNPTENLKVEVGGEKLLVYKNQFEGIIQLTQENIEQKKLLVKAIDSNGLLGQEYVYLSNLIEADLQLSFDERLSEHSKLFSAFAGNNLFTEGAGIIVPDSAVIEHKKISISALRKKDIAPMNSGMINVTKGGGAYRFLPDGTKFAKHVQIQVAYDNSLVPSGYTEKDIQTYYFSTESKRWVSIEKDTVDIASKMIVSNTNHFTDYINGIIQVPETPETSAFIPTMMSDIKAANPTSGMTLISPPEASQKGSAGVSYPIKVPSGRGGMQPSLAIQYNSDGGNGLLGLGWDMSTSALSIDTRWGVPILSDTHETEIYTLNGEQLMYPKIKNVEQDSVDWMPNRHYDATNADDVYSTVERVRIDNAVFTMRRQGGFETLERFGTNPSDYYWKVTNTDGVVSWYGGKTGVEENYVLKNAEGKVVHWSLYMVEDVHGNNMKYYYTKETIGSISGVNSNLDGSVFYFLNKITYTGFQDEEGSYSVEFIPTNSYREDINIDSKLGVKLAITKLLNTIQVKHQNELIRRYNLNYDPGFSKFGKNRLLSIVEADASNVEFYRHEFEYYDDIDDGEGNDVYFSAGVEVNLCPDEEVIEPPAYCYIAYDVKRIEVGQSAVVYYNNIAVQGGPFNNYADIISQLNSQFSGQFFYDISTGTIKVISPTVLPQTIAIYIDGIGGVNNFTVCQSEANRSEGATQSYTFENTYPFGDPECPSFINTEFMVTGNEPMPSYNSYFSPLGSSATKGEGFGGYLGLIGVGCNWFAKNITFGFGIGVSGNRTKSEVSLIDINGDGLSDIVTQNGNQIRYRPHIVTRTFDQQGEEIIGHTFGLSRMITGIDRFYYSTGKSEQYNFSFNSVFSLGWEKSVSKSTTNIYFTDANGDGLIDIVKNGLVYFNHVESNGNLTFIPDSEASENLVIVAAPVSVTEPEEDPEFTLPSYDVVKVWEAPADGVITIDNDITLLDASQSAVVTIEKKNATVETQQCYSVDFVAPSLNREFFKYFNRDFNSNQSNIYTSTNGNQNPINPLINGNCAPVGLRIKNITLNGIQTAPTNANLLFIVHGNTNGYEAQCNAANMPIYCPNFDSLNPLCADSSVRSPGSEDIIHDWYENLLNNTSLPYTAFTFKNNCYNRLQLYTLSNAFDYQYEITHNYDFTFFSTETFTGQFVNEERHPQNFWYTNNNIKIPNQILGSTSQGFVTIGLNSQVHINGSLLGTFNLVDDFASFQAAFQAVYGTAFQLTAPTAANNYTISIQMYGSTPFTNIMITPVANPSQSSTYPFTVTENCSVQRSSNMNLITPSYADIEPTKEAKEFAINSWLADGKELTIPYEEVHPLLSFDFTANEKYDRITGVYLLEIKADQARWFDQDNNPIDGDLASKLLDLSGIDLLAYNRRFQEEHIQRTNQERKNRQINAQNWLTTYYDTKQSTLPERTNSSFLRSENQSECQETNALCLLYGTELNSTNVNVVNSLTTNCNGQPLAVEKGDRIYFRLHTNATGNPPVNWNPSISYVDNQYQGIVDQNGYNVYNTSYSDGFILTQSRAFTVPGKVGNASITWQSFTVNQPSDDIVFKVIKQAVNIDTQQLVPGSETVIYSQVCASNSNTNVIPTGLSSVTFTDDGTITQFLFVVESTSNVKWKDYTWNPVVTTTITENVIGENGTTTEGELTSTETNYPIVDYTVYKKYVCGPLYSTFDVSQVNGGANLTIRPMYGGVFSSGDYGKLHFVVKNNGKLVGSRSLVVNNGSLQSVSSLPAYDNPIVMDNLIGSEIEIGFYAENDQENKGGELLVAKLQAAANSTVRISYSGSNYAVPKSNVNLHHRYNRFGPMYRQWGQFFYDPAQVSGATATTYGNLIKEDVLFKDYDLTELQALIDAGEGLDLVVSEEDSGDAALTALTNLQADYEAFAQNGSSFLPPTALREEGAEPKWIAFHRENYAAEYTFRAAPMSQSLSSEYDVEPYNYQGLLNTGAVGINKIFRSKGQNISAGGSYAGIGGSVSKSIQGSGKLVTDYTDLNGDRYPDVVTTDKIQFTTRTGGLKTEINRENEEQIVTLNSNNNFGLGVSGGFGGKNDDQGSKGSTPQKMTTTTNSTKSSTSIGLSGNFSTGKSFTDSFWSDVNGDGLSDLITKNVTSIQVFLNKGGKLESSSAVWTNLGNVFESRATNIGGGVGLSLWNSSIQGGVSLTSSWNNTKNTFLDINGDGLVDFVDSDDELNVAINRGNRYIAQQQWSDYNLKKESVSVTAGGNLAFTIAPNFGIPFTSLCIKFFALTVNGNVSTSTNKTEKTITDFDGDGYPDLIEKISGTQVRVHHSKIRRTDKLKSVTNSLGGKFTLDYQVHKITYDNPHPKWVLSTVEIDDKYNLVNDGQDIYKKNFVYENPRYDRRERDFYGFETVTSIDYTVDEEGEQDEVYRTSVTKYHNRSYFLKGLVKETALYKGTIDNNLLFSRSENEYEIRRLLDDNLVVDTSTGGVLPLTFDVGGTEGRRSAIVFLTKQKSYVYELGSSPLVNESVLKYDEKGRVVVYDYLGNPSDANDNYKTIIKYHDIASLTAKNIIKIPAVVVASINGTAVRQRETDDIDSSTGLIQTIKHFYNTSDFARVDLKYDEYGNIVHIFYPENETGQRMEYTYGYDTEHHKYIINTTDAFGYSSESNYNSKFDVPELVKDLAGNETWYKYDSNGRLVLVLGPKEIANQSPYTIAFSYFPKYTDLQSSPYQGLVTEEEFVPVALTNHIDEQHNNNTIDTYTFVDGMSRVMQVKKDITINRNENPTQSPVYIEMMSVSGAVTYDEFGRAIQQYHPSFEGKSNSINFKYNQDAIVHFKQSNYDELDRVVESIDEEGNQSFAEYSIDGAFHKTRSVTQQSSTVDIISESFKDVNGRVIKTNNVGPNGDIFTHFAYNSIGELLNYTDDMGMITSYKYDLLGRKVYMNHPDRGDLFYRYDDASNLTYLQTTNLATDNAFIHYGYQYNRLESIKYPEVV
ncbi:MAG TPA: SpvB/TcaC N-terminal domain-containing protein, partial [Flavobacterium sp.]|nr:SpvB/TcaC N-terminal domain-containing protein [Flavobacterium sp.]